MAAFNPESPLNNGQNEPVAFQVKAWGTRGSIAVSSAENAQAGGNTTCYEVISRCLPDGMKLMLDAGTGFVPAGWSYLSELGTGKLQYAILFTHWHFDHIMGLTLAPPTFIDDVPMTLYGPVDHSVGPEEMVKHLFKRPFFPVDAKKIAHKMKYKPLEDFDCSVIVCHPKGGMAVFNRDRYVTLLKDKKQIPINGASYDVCECLVITMQPTNHGDCKCISYRFEEKPTGKVFVFATDHEDVVALSVDFRKHLQGADLLIMDAQYDHTRYNEKTANFGHGTPHGVIKHGLIAGVKKLGITHHDPRSTDAFLNGMILSEAIEVLGRLSSDFSFKKSYRLGNTILTDQDVFLCYDYTVYFV